LRGRIGCGYALVDLAADVSRSISEFALAARLPRGDPKQEVARREFDLSPGAIAVAYVEWAGEGKQMLEVDWATSRNSEDGRSFAAALTGAAFFPTHLERLGDELAK
jgi:hypothetical protein